MKEILLVLVMDGALVTILTLIFRHGRVEDRAALIARAFITTAPVYLVLHGITPRDLWFLGPRWVNTSPWASLLGLGFYTASVFGGILQVHNLAARALSVHLLIDLLGSGATAAGPADLEHAHAVGAGMESSFEQRVASLRNQGLIEIVDGCARLTRRGRRVASGCAWIRRFLNRGTDPAP